jgi:amidophosphoribosyltransferase
LFYQSLDDLVDATQIGEDAPTRFDTSCFSGEYVTGDIDDAYLERLFASRNDAAKFQSSEDDEVIDMHNDGS